MSIKVPGSCQTHLEMAEEANEPLANGYVERNNWEDRNGNQNVPINEVGSGRK